MIIQYDTRPNATIDEKLKSLIESIQLAFNEIGIKDNVYQTSQNADINTVVTMLLELSETIGILDSAVTNLSNSVGTLEDTTIPGINTRVNALESKIPAAPNVDGTYRLTVTVTSEVPAYTWELVV